jgi:hypothetical protein
LAKGISLQKSGSGRTPEQEVLKVEAEKRLDHGLTQLGDPRLAFPISGSEEFVVIALLRWVKLSHLECLEKKFQHHLLPPGYLCIRL